MYYRLLWLKCNLLKELEKIFVAMAFVLVFCVGNLSAQYAKLVDVKKYSKTELSLFNASVAYFEAADYTNAYMGFSQLHSWYANDPVFNYYCGASMVMLRNEYDKAIKYLTLAYDNDLKEADYYLGLAYNRKYLFTKSITFYSRYREYLVATTKGRSPLIAQVDDLIRKARMANNLGQESYVLKVMSNSKVKRGNFHFSYGRKLFNGSIVVKPDFFRLRNDKNNKDIDLVYVLDTIALVSSYGNDMKTGLDLYVSYKTEEGWAPLQLLPGKVNTDFDEAFPFLSSDGTLYFASKGHNSIGGYDIFKSEYDASSGQWGMPENLGFPINTPYDDFMFAIESNGKSAFFASDRSSKDGQVMVCRYVVEPVVEKIIIKTEEDFAEQAELQVTPGAEAEYERILHEPAVSPEVKDSTPEKEGIKHEIDTTDLFVSTKTMLDEKVAAVSNYDEYSKKLNAYAKMTSNKIRNARASGANAGMSQAEISRMANSVVTFYDLAQKFNSVYTTATPTLERCVRDMENLETLDPNSGEYQFKLHNISVSVGKINAKSPLEVMIAEKKKERKQADDALKKLSRNMVKDRKNLRDINDKLESVMQLIQKETDPKLRERYVNEHKSLENSKVDAINGMKNMQVEAKRLNMMIEKADESIRMLQGIEDLIANIDLNNLEEEENGGVASEDITELKDFISEEEEKVTAEFEKAVGEDESLYSELIDYESIGTQTESDVKLVTDDVLSLEDYMSSSTLAVVKKMAETDSLYTEKSRLESQFDVAETDEEKTELLNRINATHKQIAGNEKEIESKLSYDENPSVANAIQDFGVVSKNKVESETWSDLLSSTQNLIEKSKDLSERMSEQKNSSAAVDKAKLLGKVKSDIDNQIVENVAEMHDIVTAQQAKKDIADMNREVSKIRSSAQDKSVSADVMKDISSVSKKLEASKNETSSSNLDEAENILDGTIVKRIAILNEEYDAESRVYNVLSEKYSTSKSSDRQRQQADVVYYSALEDKQQADAEMDDVARMRYLSEANKKMKSANSALMQAISPETKSETSTNDEVTESILNLYNEIQEQKNVAVASHNSNSNEGKNDVANNRNANDSQNGLASGTDDASNATSSSQSLQHSVTLQTDLTKRISTNNDDITTIATNMATADRGEKKRLETFLGEVTAERNGNVRMLGEEKQRFYAELDKSKHDDIAKTSASTDYTNRYADYRQSLYILTNADQSAADMTEKLTEAEKSEYALLQTIIPNVDAETKSVLMPIYNGLDEKYGNLASTTSTNNQSGVVEKNNENTTSSPQSLQHSVTLQTDLTKRISTNNDDITTIATNMATANRSEKKRLETYLGEVISERNDNVRTLGEEKQRFYAELDKAKHDDIAKTSASTDYTNRYADYLQSLYSLTNADQSAADMTEKLIEAEKSEYALLQTIIPNMDAETKSVLMPIYNGLDAKYGNLASSTSTNQQSGVEAKDNGNTISSSQSLQHSVTLQTDLTKRISTNNDDITTIATNMATANRGEKKRLEIFLGEVTAERNGNVRTLGEEKQRFYAELDKSKHDDIAKTSASTDYTNRYADYRQSLYSLTNADPSSADMSEKFTEAEKSEYALLQTIIPNVDAETKSVLMPIYNGLDAKYGNLASSTSTNQQSGVETKDNGNSTSSSQSLQHSVTLQTDLTKRISTNNDDITTIATNMATADRGEKKRLETFLGEVTAERNGNVRTLGEEKQRFYAELDKSKHDDIAKTSASTDYTNRYADYRQSLYSLTNADPSSADMTEKLTEAEKSEYALLQTIIPNVDAETKSVLMPIYNGLDAKYGNLASSTSTNQQSGVETKDNGNSTSSSQSLQHSVTLQTDLTKRISTNNDDITTIATNMATADRGEKKRLQTFLGEVTAERNDNVRTLGEEKQRFYAELDKSKHDDIAKTSASADYTNRYADYRQSLYSLTNADPSSADMTEKLTEAEKSEYALLQTIIPNVDAETKSVLMPIYNGLDEKYGNLASTTSTNNQSGVVEKNNENTTSSPQSLQHSVTLQTDLTKRISTNNDDITTIATNMATADRGEKKRLQTFLGEVTAERNDNVRTLGEEKQRFYAELDKSKHDDIAKTSASADYTNRYADYRQSLYSLTNADPSSADMTEKLTDAEKSEYALLQTIIPNVDTETSIVLVQIYSELDAKYGNTSPAEPAEASASSTAQNDPMSNSQSVIVSNNPSSNPPAEPVDPSRPLSVVEGKGNDISAQNFQQNVVAKELDDNSAITTSVNSQQLKASVVRQSEISNRITINASEISAIEGVIAASAGSDKQRLQNELGEITALRNSNVRSLCEEKQNFYAEIDKSVHDAIAKSDVSSEYTNRYTTYRQSLHNLANAEQSGADMSQKLAEAEKAEYELLQTIIPNADSETKSILLPVYNGLEAKYGTTGGVEIAGVVPETYSRSMTLQEQMVRNIEISTKEIERLEQRKEVAKKSEQRRIADDIAREESQKLDDIQKLAVEKSKFYSELNSSLETILPTLSDSARQEYKLAYDSYDETLRTMKIGLGFYDMSVANKIYSDSEIQEYKLLQQMSQVATGETKTVVDNMIGRMEANNSTLRRYKVVVDYVIVENTVNNASTNSNVAEKRDSVSLNIPDSNSTILASVDSTVVAPKKKSMSGFSADSYGIFEKPEINMGLYYRIQIVAANVKYRMPYFNGLSLIFTEQIPNTNIIRYMTGEYYRYVSAREDLPKVRGLGFSDAFIVAYYNGKRISIGEARRLEALQNAEENEEIPIVIRHEAPADYVEPESIIASSQTKTETIANAENGTSVANNSASGQSVTEGNSAVYSENVAVNGQIVSSGNVVDSQDGIALDSHEIPSKGVYYAVQIGVYKDRRQPSQMKGVSPIDYETMPNGYIRHTSGRFGNYDQARASQANIRRQGISDAFVIAYIDGRKVSFSEAIEYQKSLESRVIAEANAENTTTKTQGVVSSEENLSNVEYAPLNLNTGTEENNKEGISYYVQIGAFSKSPDPEILSVFSKVAGDKIHVKFPREGLQVYRIGVFSSYEEAQNTLAEARSFGIVDAFIVAFKGEEQISSSEAIRLQNAVRQIEGNSGETINNNVGQKSSQTIQPTSNAGPKPVVPAETLQQANGGVEYFVQLGAFVHTPDTRSMATFRAIATTSGSRLSTVQNGKFTNYRVGAFKKFDDVKAAVENARSMGVTDAFVVAFYNGERIPVVEAKEKE